MVTTHEKMNDIEKEQQKQFNRSRMVKTRANMNDIEKEQKQKLLEEVWLQ